MIYVYGDDGADANKQRVIAVSVIAGREEWWQSVEDQWVAGGPHNAVFVVWGIFKAFVAATARNEFFFGHVRFWT